jgi:uncharacterized membrane protein YedE/YeeE
MSSMSLALSASSVVAALVGGALIGGAASLLLRLNGRVAGVSGILSGLFSREREEVTWRVLFIAGLLAGGALFAFVHPAALAVDLPPSAPVTIAGGLLVGVGTRLSGGCTSGHGVCGISRLSLRSIAATLTFLATGMLTVFLSRHAGGAP